MTEYRMYYQAVGDQGNVDISANETEYVLLGLQYGLSYTITMLTKSQHLPSRLSSSVWGNYTGYGNNKFMPKYVINVIFVGFSKLVCSYGEQCEYTGH